MAGEHGTRYRYVQGCRCSECKRAHRLYAADLQKRHATGDVAPRVRVASAVFAGDSGELAAGPGRVEVAITQELEGLAQAAARPGLVETALAMARILDNPRSVSQQPAAAGKLADILDRLRKGSDQRKSRLASVRDMAKTGS